MCLPNFKEFQQIDKSNPLIGYRVWRNPILPKSLDLMGENKNYIWALDESIKGHEVLKINSGLYAYNNYNYNNYNNYNNNYNYYYNYNYYSYYYNYNYYYYTGIIKQWGKTAIHLTGQRSEFAKIETLFTIKESDITRDTKFINWVKEFNRLIIEIANRYEANTIHWQDFCKI